MDRNCRRSYAGWIGRCHWRWCFAQVFDILAVQAAEQAQGRIGGLASRAQLLAQLEHGGDLYVQTPAGLVAWGEWQKERAAERAVLITTSRATRGVVTA